MDTYQPIRDALAKLNLSELTQYFRPGATEAAIEDVQAHLGFKLPDVLLDHWRKHDGVDGRILPGFELVAVDHVPTLYEEIVEVCEIESLDVDLVGLVPFAWDEQPPYICVDNRPSGEGKIVEVCEMVEFTVVAQNLHEWIAARVAELEDDSDFISELKRWCSSM